MLDMAALLPLLTLSIVYFDLERLDAWFGLRGTLLSWIQSFITGRTQVVFVSVSRVLCAVPQGTSMLFLLHTADVLDIVRSHGLTGHS